MQGLRSTLEILIDIPHKDSYMLGIEGHSINIYWIPSTYKLYLCHTLGVDPKIKLDLCPQSAYSLDFLAQISQDGIPVIFKCWICPPVLKDTVLNKIFLQGALNLYSQEELYNFFLKKPIVPLDTQKRIVIVFHCEFSSERGPRMWVSTCGRVGIRNEPWIGT